MAVGKIGGGGRKGGAGGVKGSAPSGTAKRVEFGGKVDRTESLSGPSRMAGSGNVTATDPVTAHALEIAKQLKAGQIKTKEEATKKLVSEILKEKIRMQSKALTHKIAETLQDDPRLSQALERLWSKTE